ncbi:MAG: hypothetical protein GF329_21465 [Candidatus Lokiarchaeota archaeon]|nr:hypothetical protein [Candidatus Lokiarchaeota archaeon]
MEEKKKLKGYMELSPQALSKILDAARQIPASVRGELAEDLMDQITEGNFRIPGDIAKSILHLWQTGKLETNTGIERLIESCVKSNSEETFKILSEYGLDDTVSQIKEAVKL